MPVIFTALGAVVIALKSAQYKYHGPAGRLKARDERRMNALVIAIYVGFILCWIPHYCYEVQSELFLDFLLMSELANTRVWN